MEFYCDYNNLQGVDELREIFRQEIYTSYLEISALEAIAHEEGIEVDEMEFSLLKENYRAFNENNSSIDEDALRRSLVIRSTVNWLVSNNTINEA